MERAKTPDVVIPSNLIKDKLISAEHKITYGHIYYYCGTNGYLWHNNETLAELIGVSVSSIQRALAVLEIKNYIVRIFDTKHSKEKALYGDKEHKRVIWLYDKYHGAKARLKNRKNNEKKYLSLRVFKKLVKKYYPPLTPIYTFSDNDFKLFNIMWRGEVCFNEDNLLTLGGFSFDGNSAAECWSELFIIYQTDFSLFPILEDAKKRKMNDEEIVNILSIIEKKLREKPKVKEPMEDAPLFRTKTQYPLKGFDFFVLPIEYKANFEEIDLYSPYSIYEVDDGHKRRRKKLNSKQFFLSLELDTWEALKAETKRTFSGYTSRTIKKIMDANKELKEENDVLHKLILKLLKEK